MHEFGITSRIVQTVFRVADEHGAARVARVDLLVGQLTFLNVDQVKLAYDLLVRGTSLEGSQLLVKESPGRVECSRCHHQRQVDFPSSFDPGGLSEPLPLFSCSECGGEVSIVGGKECQITGLVLESE
ncbi:MAG: hydrogenase maturation nickel metallochaperone HypA [Chloroflexi bacterium]|nr:hydrogenase maturation nickel metallochaperone HypA [Chloroflexota bacterium]